MLARIDSVWSDSVLFAGFLVGIGNKYSYGFLCNNTEEEDIGVEILNNSDVLAETGILR